MEKASIVCYANCGFISSEMGKKSLDGVVCARWGGLNAVAAAAPFPPTSNHHTCNTNQPQKALCFGISIPQKTGKEIIAPYHSHYEKCNCAFV